jgi:hypothetical protein
MNDQELRHAAAAVANRILGNAAFIFTDALTPDQLPDPKLWDCLGVSIGFSGRPNGCFHLWAGRDFAHCAAANMLGLEEDSPGIDEKSKDVLGELLNMIAGAFLTDVFGEKQLFNLGLPEALPREELDKDFQFVNSLWIMAEGKPLLVALRTERME